MILAALGDIHGNLPALRAVFDALDREGIQTVLNTGDCVVGHSGAGEVIALLMERNIPTVQSENDRNAMRFVRRRNALRGRVDAATYDALAEASARCRSEHIEFLRHLPRTLSLRLDGIDVALAHGTLSSQTQQLSSDSPDELFRRQREIVPARIFIFGRTHEPYARFVDDALFVNPGSVGEYAGAAQFAIIDAEDEPWSTDLRTIAY